MNGETLALVGLLGIALYLATRNANAASAPGGGGFITVGEPDWSQGWGTDYSAAQNDYSAPSATGSGAPWLTPAADSPIDYSAPSPVVPGEEVSDDAAVSNMEAMLSLIRKVESNDNYGAIAGYSGTAFTDFREHPFIIDPTRSKPAGTTASGAYQMVVGTWKMARDALGLRDFSPGSQDAAAAWIIMNKRPRSYPLVISGNFAGALDALRTEWQAFDYILSGRYNITLAQAQGIYESNGGTVA